MSTSDEANGCADLEQHTLYANWLIPKYKPYFRKLVCVVLTRYFLRLRADTSGRSDSSTSDELAEQPEQKDLARRLSGSVIFDQPATPGCSCITTIDKLRVAFKAYDRNKMSSTPVTVLSDVSIAMEYALLVIDLYVAGLSVEEKASHLAQLRQLAYKGPEFPGVAEGK